MYVCVYIYIYTYMYIHICTQLYVICYMFYVIYIYICCLHIHIHLLLYHVILYYNILYYIALYVYVLLAYIILSYIILSYLILSYIILYYIILCCRGAKGEARGDGCEVSRDWTPLLASFENSRAYRTTCTNPWRNHHTRLSLNRSCEKPQLHKSQATIALHASTPHTLAYPSIPCITFSRPPEASERLSSITPVAFHIWIRGHLWDNS